MSHARAHSFFNEIQISCTGILLPGITINAHAHGTCSIWIQWLDLVYMSSIRSFTDPLRGGGVEKMASKVGYDYDFVTAPPKSLECPVCLMTFRDPHVISCCGNEFCQLCIERVQRDGKPCPLCNELNFTTFLHKKLVREVNGLVVRCPQKELGCEWEGELGQVEQHLNPGAGPSSSSGCGYVMVECSFQCGAHLQRRMVGEHEMESCPKRPIEMQVASLMRKFEVITAENKILKQKLIEVKEEMSEVKEAHKHKLDAVKQTNQTQQEELGEVKQELNEVKKKYESLQKSTESIQTFCDEVEKKQDAIKVDIGEQKLKCVSLQTHTTPLPVPPFYCTVENVNHFWNNKLVYRSDPFYSHPGGYKMVVVIHSDSSANEKRNLYLGVAIQHGEFDDQLRWPFKGKVTVQAYNHTKKKWSKEGTIVLSEEQCAMEHIQRCLDFQSNVHWGFSNFLSHSELQNHYINRFGNVLFRVMKVQLN